MRGTYGVLMNSLCVHVFVYRHVRVCEASNMWYIWNMWRVLMNSKVRACVYLQACGVCEASSMWYMWNMWCYTTFQSIYTNT